MTRDKFEDVYNKYYLSCLKYAVTFTHDVDMAHDIVIDVFLKAWTKLKDNTTQESYLMIATANACRSFLYNLRNRKRIELNMPQTFEEHKELEDIRYIVLFNLICYLPPECKKTFELSLLGYTSPQIAKILGLSRQTITNQKAIAINKLKRLAYKYRFQWQQ